MSTKKKKETKKKNRIVPEIKNCGSTNFTKLKSGDCFLMGGGLWMKENSNDTHCRGAINLATGDWKEELCDTFVIPVDIEICWTKK